MSGANVSCGSLEALFELVSSYHPLSPGDLAVRCTPSVATLLVCLLVVSRRTVFSPTFRAFGLVLGSLAAVASTLLTWRLFDLLHCDEVFEKTLNAALGSNVSTDDHTASDWQWVAVLSSAALHSFLLLLLWHRAPRVGILIALTLAAGCLVADWFLSRLLQARTDPLVAIQQTWCLQAAVLLTRVVRPIGSVRSSASRAPVIDSLPSRRGSAPSSPITPVGRWSWFW